MGWQGHHAGYVILTLQPDGSWKDDWDGEVHLHQDAALRALVDACSTLGHEAARLAEMHWWVAP